MRLLRAVAPFAVMGFVGQAAAAQETDAIGALLDDPAAATGPATVDGATAPPVRTAPSPATVTPPSAYTPPPFYPRPAVQAPLPYVNAPASPYASWPPPRRPQLTAPVHIDEIGKTPEGPPTVTDLGYEARMRQSFASAQGLQGPLDGAWTLRAGSTELYDLQLVDSGSGAIEGAWRDPRRRGAADASGFIDDISRVGGQLTIRLTARPGAQPVIVMLSAGSDGAWSGELSDRGDLRPVTLRRD